VVVVVAHAGLEAGGRSRGLDAPDEAFGDQHAERVVDRLPRDGADLRPDDLGRAVGRDVRLRRHRPQDGQALGRHLYAAFSEQVGWVRRHGSRLIQVLD
jgi:hypothetical protein